MSILLTLPARFGGARFGPFTQAIALGSDADHCHVVLPASMGIAPVHAWIQPHGGGWIVQPTAHNALVFVQHSGRGPAQVQGHAQVQPGDAVILAHPQGAPFTLESAAAAPHGPPGPPGFPRPPGMGGRRPPTAGAMAQEVKRQAGVRFMTSGGSQLSTFLYRLQSGAFLHPRYIVGAVIGLGGALAALCSGVAAFVSAHI